MLWFFWPRSSDVITYGPPKFILKAKNREFERYSMPRQYKFFPKTRGFSFEALDRSKPFTPKSFTIIFFAKERIFTFNAKDPQ